MSSMINPSIGCKKHNLYKYITFKKKPENEIDFGLSKKKYLRYYYKCKVCGHLTAKHKNFFFDKLYDDLYFKSTYVNEIKLEKTFERIQKLPSSKSDNFHRIKRIKKMIKKIFNFEKIKILDVGAGTGVFPIKLQNNRYNISVIEPDKTCAKFIRNKSNLKIKVINKKFLKVKKKDLIKYNLITFNKVLEHVEEPILFLKKSIKFLKKKNLIYIEVPDASAINDKKEGKYREEFGLGHHHVFSKKSLQNIFAFSKIKLLEIKSIREPSGKYTLFAFGVYE